MPLGRGGIIGSDSLVNPDCRPPIDPLFEQGHHGFRQILPHHHRHGVQQRLPRIRLNQTFKLRTALRGQGRPFRHQSSPVSLLCVQIALRPIHESRMGPLPGGLGGLNRHRCAGTRFPRRNTRRRLHGLLDGPTPGQRHKGSPVRWGRQPPPNACHCHQCPAHQGCF